MAGTDKIAIFLFNKPGVSMFLALFVVIICMVILSGSGLKVRPFHLI